MIAILTTISQNPPNDNRSHVIEIRRPNVCLKLNIAFTLSIHPTSNSINMPSVTWLALILLLPSVKADAWDDFTNNLATDLTPLLALFGEAVTKQYLSESVGWLDNFIFAMAPLGILTAVVSAIRVCGGPSLGAFIGRAQEGRGVAEAELCSSTSRDVCELWNNGGIARVFGRPRILELVHYPHVNIDDLGKEPAAGLYLPSRYFPNCYRNDLLPKTSKSQENMETADQERRKGNVEAGKSGCAEKNVEMSDQERKGRYVEVGKAGWV